MFQGITAMRFWGLSNRFRRSLQYVWDTLKCFQVIIVEAFKVPTTKFRGGSSRKTRLDRFQTCLRPPFKVASGRLLCFSCFGRLRRELDTCRRQQDLETYRKRKCVQNEGEAGPEVCGVYRGALPVDEVPEEIA